MKNRLKSFVCSYLCFFLVHFCRFCRDATSGSGFTGAGLLDRGFFWGGPRKTVQKSAATQMGGHRLSLEFPVLLKI